MSLLVTGAAGFIGSNLVHYLRNNRPERRVVSFDALTYSGNLENLAGLKENRGHFFVKGDITDEEAVEAVFRQHEISGVIHLAAESHVDRSIVDPLAFVRTNIEGTAVLLRVATEMWKGRSDVRFHHVSTDEVFGSLGEEGEFAEETPYAPRSPYAASKAASDHLVRAWHNTYGLSVVISNCSNNYGPWQFPEKLIPVVITRAMRGEPIPVYAKGENVRDWLFVEDHCAALCLVFENGQNGRTYCIGGGTEVRNIDLVRSVLDELDSQLNVPIGTSRKLIRFVQDRPGHDYRYAIDSARIQEELGWRPSVSLSQGLARTVRWYLENRDWWQRVMSGEYRDFESLWYDSRLATTAELETGD